MCPDRNLLSAYFDGEIDSRYESDIEAHLAGCDSCREYIRGLDTVSAVLHSENDQECTPDTAITWRLLQKRLAYTIPLPVWRRRVQIPAPVLAFATLIVIMLSVGLIYSLSSQRNLNSFDSVTRTQLEGSELTSVEAILSYLDARGEGKSSTFNLPHDTKLQYWSEPTLIRAADYHRGRD